MNNKCVYFGACNLSTSEECNEKCIRYREMHFLMENSKLPKSLQKPLKLIPEKQDMQAFVTLKDYKDNIVERVKNGSNLYLYSKTCGNGKTSWSIKLLLAYFNEVWIGNGFIERGLFIDVTQFLRELKQNITTKSDSFIALEKLILEVDLVVWDDVATTSISDYDYSVLFPIINQRLLNGKANIYTSNLDGEQLAKQVGSRLASRIWNSSKTIELFGNDRRCYNG